MSRRGLGLPKAKHVQAGELAVKRIEHAATQIRHNISEGSCGAATINYAEMHNQVGVAEAHMRSANNAKIWIPSTTIQEASGAYVEACVRDRAGTLSGPRKRRHRAR